MCDFKALGELLNSAQLAVSIAAYTLGDAKACLVSCMQILHKHHHKISFCRHGTLDMESCRMQRRQSQCSSGKAPHLKNAHDSLGPLDSGQKGVGTEGARQLSTQLSRIHRS